MVKYLNANQRSALQRVMHNPELQPWLFKKVTETVWFDAFKKRKLLLPELNPKPQENEENIIQVPSWPITEFLVRSSSTIKENNDYYMAKKYISLVREVTRYARDKNFSNYKTWGQFSHVLRNMPVELITEDDLKYIDFWLNDKLDNYLVAHNIYRWILEIIESEDVHSKQLSIELFNILFKIVSRESKLQNSKQEALLRIDHYLVNNFIEELAKKSTAKLDLPIIEVFESKLIEILEINKSGQYSNLWRNAIEDCDQNNSYNNIDEMLLKLYRDSFLSYYQKNRTHASEIKLVSMLNSDYQIIRRIAIYVSNQSFELLDESTIGYVIQSGNFYDKYRHELWHFLNKHFGELQLVYREQIINTILHLEGDNVKHTAYKQANWYAAIMDLDTVARVSYQKCISIIGTEPEHPDFSFYTTFSSGVNKSPITVAELALMSNEINDLIQFLNEYKKIKHLGEESLEGLIETFGELISNNSNLVFDNLEKFVDLKPHYLYKIFSIFLNFWKLKKQLDWDKLWPKIINFSSEVFQNENFWLSPSNEELCAFIGDSHWVVSEYSRLIESGCEKDEYAFDISLCKIVKESLEYILIHEAGGNFEIDSDYVSVTINTPRGRCLEAYLKLALYQCRNAEKTGEQHLSIWKSYEPVFNDELDKPSSVNEYEFITLAVLYIRNLFFLSKSWTMLNLEKLFGKKGTQQWLCSIQTYTYVGRLIPEVHKLFMSNGYYLSLLDDLNLTESFKNRYIDYICISYLREYEIFGDNDLITVLLCRGNELELRELIRFLWSIKDENIPVLESLIFELWPKLIEIINSQIDVASSIASKLVMWVEFINKVNEESFYWLLSMAPLIKDNYSGTIFLKELARLSDIDALRVAKIWKKTLSNSYYIYDLEPIKILFINLISQGNDGKSLAKDIVSVYIQKGDEYIVNLYNKIKS